ncbi:hypothetical protein E3N88_05496 [Mikania micrantha]|uniref:DUF632 domain-containing protein n=1 Tax=Mikania micrantha TaxID=192012 RepID=A0A5N6PN98_9ASTR|nr:hypothetical protein E3N88_05496 [Mikania micrantha]
MRVITWNRSFKGLPEADDKDDFDSEENETHATVLDKMLAWEKKLYDEVKAGELMKFDYQKKIASLNRLKKRGASTDHLERTKATVSHLHTRYIVDMQSMDSTVSEINRLRDEQLYPKLVQLVHGMEIMWENMKNQHDKQSQIVQALRSLDISHSPKQTSDHHYNNTRQLHVHVQMWHSQFEKLMAHQKEYIKSLNNWLKLNLIPIDNNLREKVSSPQRPQNPPIQILLRTWNEFLEKLPEEGARTAIHNFAAVMDTIFQYQTDEMKMKERCEETRRELTRKARKFEDWYNKYIHRRTDDEMENDKEVIAEQQITVELLKKRLEEEEEAYQRQCIQVRDKSLMNLKTGLPENSFASAQQCPTHFDSTQPEQLTQPHGWVRNHTLHRWRCQQFRRDWEGNLQPSKLRFKFNFKVGFHVDSDCVVTADQEVNVGVVGDEFDGTIVLTVVVRQPVILPVATADFVLVMMVILWNCDWKKKALLDYFRKYPNPQHSSRSIG